jgi:hypothetical protein
MCESALGKYALATLLGLRAIKAAIEEEKKEL